MFNLILQGIRAVVIQTMVNYQRMEYQPSNNAAKQAVGADLADDIVALNVATQSTPEAETQKIKPASIWFKVAAVVIAIFLIGYFQMDVIIAMEIFAVYSMIMMARQAVMKKV